MDVCSLIRARLKKLQLEQKDLALAADVTESYVSQLLTRKKLPPAPDRTDIYDKMGRFLGLPKGELAALARAERLEELRRGLEEPHSPLLQETRELILRKCAPARQAQIRAIFERHAFGELEQLITQKLLDVVCRAARRELNNETWLQQVARLSGTSYAQMRVIVLDFLDTDIFSVSKEHCGAFLNPLISSWDIELTNFDMVIRLNERLAPGKPRKFAFVETDFDSAGDAEPGFNAFMQDRALSGDVSDVEAEFLRGLRFSGKRPGALYYYRALQNLRDPLHFEPG